MDTPVLKIGAVVVRKVLPTKTAKAVLTPPQGGSRGASGVGGGLSTDVSGCEVLIVQPIPKTKGEVPHFVLPRGSRQYRDAAGSWHDVRDAETGRTHAATLEPFMRGLAREIEEEAGVDPAMLARAEVIEMGAMAFQSRTKGVYPIHWFVVVLQTADAAVLAQTVPVDAMAVRWAMLSEIQAMADRGEFSAGYVPVVEVALGRLQTNP